MAVSSKGTVLIDGIKYSAAEICSYIAASIGSKNRVTYTAERNGGRFKAGNKTVAVSDGHQIILISTNKAIELPKQGVGTNENSGMRPEIHPSRAGRKHDVHAFMEAGSRLLDEGKYEEALRCFEEAVGYGDDAFQLCGKAKTLALLGRHEEANRVIDECMEDYPNVPLTFATKIEILAYDENYDEIVEFTTERLKVKPYDWDMTSSKIQALIDSRRYEEIIEYADWCLDRTSEAIRVMRQYAKSEFGEKEKMARDTVRKFGKEAVPEMAYIEKTMAEYKGETYKSTMYLNKIRALIMLYRDKEALEIIEAIEGDREVDQLEVEHLKMYIMSHTDR